MTSADLQAARSTRSVVTLGTIELLRTLFRSIVSAYREGAARTREYMRIRW
jgi:hypothetical protein